MSESFQNYRERSPRAEGDTRRLGDGEDYEGAPTLELAELEKALEAKVQSELRSIEEVSDHRKDLPAYHDSFNSLKSEDYGEEMRGQYEDDDDGKGVPDEDAEAIFASAMASFQSEQETFRAMDAANRAQTGDWDDDRGALNNRADDQQARTTSRRPPQTERDFEEYQPLERERSTRPGVVHSTGRPNDEKSATKNRVKGELAQFERTVRRENSFREEKGRNGNGERYEASSYFPREGGDSQATSERQRSTRPGVVHATGRANVNKSEATDRVKGELAHFERTIRTDSETNPDGYGGENGYREDGGRSGERYENAEYFPSEHCDSIDRFQEPPPKPGRPFEDDRNYEECQPSSRERERTTRPGVVHATGKPNDNKSDAKNRVRGELAQLERGLGANGGGRDSPGRDGMRSGRSGPSAVRRTSADKLAPIDQSSTFERGSSSRSVVRSGVNRRENVDRRVVRDDGRYPENGRYQEAQRPESGRYQEAQRLDSGRYQEAHRFQDEGRYQDGARYQETPTRYHENNRNNGGGSRHQEYDRYQESGRKDYGDDYGGGSGGPNNMSRRELEERLRTTGSSRTGGYQRSNSRRGMYDRGGSQWEHSPSRYSQPPPPSFAPRSPMTSNRRTPTQAKQPVEVEIGPGIWMELRGADETWTAIMNGAYCPATCFGCSLELLCVLDAEYVLCPECRVVNPIFEDDMGMRAELLSSDQKVFGVGLGFKPDDLMRWQSEMARGIDPRQNFMGTKA
jgi:hypothetical protein